MGHDHHFLERLDRVERDHVEYALSLYRDHLAVRWLLARLEVTREERVALAIGSVDRGPYIVLAGDGGFVTCLSAGMRTGALEIVPREKVDKLVRGYAEQRTREQIAEDVRRAGESNLEFMTRLLERGHEMCREDIAACASFAALMPRSCFNGSFAMFLRVFEDLPKVAKVTGSIRPSHREAARAIHRTWWVGAHSILLAGAGTWDMTEDIADAAAAHLSPTRVTSMFGSTAHIARSAWSAASWTANLDREQANALVDCYEGSLHHSAHPMFALESIVALAAMATRHEARRDGIVRFLAAEAARTDQKDTTRLAALALETIERPSEAAHAALDCGRQRWRGRTGETGDVPDDLATAALLSDDANAAFDLDAARVLVQAAPVIAGASIEDFYFPRSAARRAIQEWTPEDTLALVGRYPDVRMGPTEPVRAGPKVGRNDPCPCGSGRKYKKCCGRA